MGCEGSNIDGKWMPCTCWRHDFVAKLLDIDSINPNGYKSSKSRKNEADLAHMTPYATPPGTSWRKDRSEVAEALRTVQVEHPPRPRKPKPSQDQWTDEFPDDLLPVSGPGKNSVKWDSMLGTWVPADVEVHVNQMIGSPVKLVIKKDDLFVSRNLGSNDDLSHMIKSMRQQLLDAERLKQAVVEAQAEWVDKEKDVQVLKQMLGKATWQKEL